MSICVIFPKDFTFTGVKKMGKLSFYKYYFGYIADKLNETIYILSNDTKSICSNGYFVHTPLGSGVSYYLSVFKWVLKNRKNANAIICQLGPMPILPVALLKPFLKFKLIDTYEFDWAGQIKLVKGHFFHALGRLIEMCFLNFCDVIIVTTSTLKKNLCKRGIQTKKEIIPIYVDTKKFKPLSMKKRKNAILFAARMHPIKNPFLLIKSFEIFNKKNKNFELLIAGSKTYGLAKEVMALVKERKLENVRFLGIIPYDKFPPIMAKCKLLVLTSRLEGSPRLLAEAMACGLPLVGTDVPGIKDMIKNNVNGFLTTERPEDIAEKIERILTDEKIYKKFSRNSRKIALEKYSLEKHLDKKVELIKKIIQVPLPVC